MTRKAWRTDRQRQVPPIQLPTGARDRSLVVKCPQAARKHSRSGIKVWRASCWARAEGIKLGRNPLGTGADGPKFKTKQSEWA